jgi:hypothetical protein
MPQKKIILTRIPNAMVERKWCVFTGQEEAWILKSRAAGNHVKKGNVKKSELLENFSV